MVLILESMRPESLSGKNTGSFAFLTIRDRLPDILTKVIDVFSRLASAYHDQKDEDKAKDIKLIIGKYSKLKNEMQTDKIIRPLEDSFEDVVVWNDFIKNLAVLVENKTEPTWYNVAWLSCECYMYRRIVEALKMSKYHSNFDPFFEQKTKSFFLSEKPMETLATYVWNCINKTNQDSLDQKRLDFEMLLEYSLWGNKCDLSISAGQQVSNQLQESSQLRVLSEHIISNDADNVWEHFCFMKAKEESRRVDFVLDNAGFELYSDLCFAEFLLDKKLCDVVYFHVKIVPWFVSDTTKFDFEWTIEQCKNSTIRVIKDIGKRWQNRVDTKTFIIVENPYWTLPQDFAAMENVNPSLYSFLSCSDLLIFKGDLNYRKLVGDRTWDFNTDFSEALHGFRPAPVCTLRTLKADVVVGVKMNVVAALDQLNPEWMTSGQYAVIQFFKTL